MSATLNTAEAQKKAAGEAAAALVESGMTVGLGTGSTAVWFVRALGLRNLDIRGVPTSLDQLCPGLDPSIVGMVARAIQKDPARRYPTLATLAADLARLHSRSH